MFLTHYTRGMGEESDMTRRVNIMMDKRDASTRMDALRARLPAVKTDRIVRWIREQREQRQPHARRGDRSHA